MSFSIWKSWAKTDQPVGSKDAVESVHLVAWHNLDVAASLYALLERDPYWQEELQTALGASQEQLLHDLPLLYALHDVGKLTDDFQYKSQAACKFLSIDPVPQDDLKYPARHDLVFYVKIPDVVKRLYGEKSLDFKFGLYAFMRGAASHHGYPLPFSKSGSSKTNARTQWKYSEGSLARLEQYLEEVMIPVFGTDLAIDWANIPDLPRASWLLGGLGMISDWLGSSPDYFPLETNQMPAEVYWRERALPQARRAVQVTRILYQPLREGLSFYEGILPSNSEERPMQKAALELRDRIREQPRGLYIIEDATGSGKTEVATALARHVMQHGPWKGVMMALPTRATANALYDRIMNLAESTFDAATLSLIHSTRFQDSRFRALKAAQSEGSTISAPQWLNSSTRQSMFSQVNVGTIDQLLLACIARYFAPLRLAALTRQVLILDEIHSMDAHMLRILKALLYWCGQKGQPVILLSATLSTSSRAQLMKAYCGEDVEHPCPDAIPALTHVTPEGGCWAKDVDVFQSRRLHWSPIYASHNPELEDWTPAEEIVCQRLLEASEGGCAVWFRNTVRTAQRAYRRLSSMEGVTVTLCHSRFTVEHRQQRDEFLIQHFGPDSTTQERDRHIVICTQVLQESLDVDFDWGVSDLCEADLLIQRSGRVHRHDRLDRGSIEIGVLMPNPDFHVGAKWLSDCEALKGTYKIYDNLAMMWSTAKMCCDRPVWDVPRDSRAILDDVADPSTLPPSMQTAYKKHADKLEKASCAIGQKTLDFSKGYLESLGKWSRDDTIGTRDGLPSFAFYLMGEDGEPLMETLGGSKLAIPVYYLPDGYEPEAPRGYDLPLLTVQQNGYIRELPHLHYSGELGLVKAA